MGNVNVLEIKKSLDSLYHLLDAVEKIVKLPEGLKDTSLKEIFKLDLHTYFMYLASSDGKITPQERDFMNTLFDMNLSIQDYVRFINEKDIYSVDFENKIPLSMKMISLFDSSIIKSDLGQKKPNPISPVFLKFYIDSGKAFISCDGNVDSKEIEDINTYIGKLTESLSKIVVGDKNLDESNEVGIIGAKKGMSSVSSPKSGFQNSSGGQHVYNESIYKVGVDIPSGKYKLFVTQGRGYYSICNDPNCDRIIENDNFYGQAYIQIFDGQYIKLNRCKAIPFDEAVLFNGSYFTAGEYLVGQEIPAGEYKLQSDGSRGYYAIKTFLPNNSKKKIISNDNFVNAAYIEVRSGQILELSRCSLKL